MIPVTKTALILAGGRGMRSADPTVPKLAQQVAGQSLLQWHLQWLSESRIERVVVVAGYLGSEVAALCTAVDNKGLEIRVIQEEKPIGTYGAVKFADQEIEESSYLVVLGDVLTAIPTDIFITRTLVSGKNVGIVAHPSTHPEDSDSVFRHWDDRVTFSPKGTMTQGIPNMSAAGVFFISSSAISKYADAVDLGTDLLRQAAADKDLYVFESSHYLKDSGTPKRLIQIEEDLSSGAFDRRGSLDLRKALLLDRDGVINPQLPEVYQANKYKLSDGVGEAILEANKEGIPVVVITNQPGIAKGLMGFDEHEQIRAAMDSQLGSFGAFVDDYFFCPHHPDSGFKGETLELKVNCSCRKPEAGLALQAADKHGFDLQRSVMVGDTWRDQGLCAEVGAEFIHISPVCDLGSEHVCFTAAPDAIRYAIKELRC